jgi:hypothetical protein
MKRHRAAGIACLVSLVASTAASAQSAKFSPIGCDRSALAAPPGVRCESTNTYGAADGPAGLFQRHWYGGTVNGRAQAVWMSEAIGPGSHFMRLVGTSEEALPKTSTFTGKGSSWTSPLNHGGGTYARFTADNLNCVAFRKGGRAKSQGYQEIFSGSVCAPRGSTLADTDIHPFIDGIRRR